MLPSGASSSIVRLAVERINADSSILEGVKLIMSYNDTNRDPVIASANFLDQITSPFPPIGVVGERDSGVCLSLSYAAGWYKIPQVSYGCTSQTLSGKSSFSFLRGVPSDRKQAQGLVELVNSFQFPGFPNLKVATISTTDEYGTSFQTVSHSLNSSSMLTVAGRLSSLKQQSTILLFFNQSSLLLVAQS
jgi:ABC-type branched-subunit amino acid transport system substrate-binding protein